MEITLVPRRIVLLLLATVGLLLIAHLVTLFADEILDTSLTRLVFNGFDFNSEKNVPTLFATLLLLTSAGLLGLIGTAAHRAGRPDRDAWVGLALIFAALGVDEAVAVHEVLSMPLRTLLNLGGIFYYAWLIPYMIVVTLLGLLYLRFFLRLPRSTRVGFVLAAVLFLGGAVGLEMVGGVQAERAGEDLLFLLFATVEESMEMLGTIVLIHTLLRYLQEQFPTLRVGLSDG